MENPVEDKKFDAFFDYGKPKDYSNERPSLEGFTIPDGDSVKTARKKFLEYLDSQAKQMKPSDKKNIKAFSQLTWEEFELIKNALNSDVEKLVDETITQENFKEFKLNPPEVKAIIDAMNKNEKPEIKSLLSRIQDKCQMKLQELIGKDGVAMYQAALAEELASKEYREAFLDKAIIEYKGAQPENEKSIIILGGSSASGKTFAGHQAVEAQLRDSQENAKRSTSTEDIQGQKNDGERSRTSTDTTVDLTDTETNSLASSKDLTTFRLWVDGAILRDISHTQEMIKKYCMEQGVIVTDLHKNSETIFKPVKKELQKAAFSHANRDLGLVIPLTFSRGFLDPVIPDQIPMPSYRIDTGEITKYRNYIKDLKKLLPDNMTINIAMHYVTGENVQEHKNVVKFMGTSRAFPELSESAATFTAIKDKRTSETAAGINLYLNDQDIKKLPMTELKKYGQGGYQFGINGSLTAMRIYYKAFSGKDGYKIKRIFNCNDLSLFTSEGQPWLKLPVEEQKKIKPILASKRLVDAWRNLPEGESRPSLEAYKQENMKNYSNIQIVYEPEKLPFGLGPSFDKILQKNLRKKGAIVSLSANNLHYLLPMLRVLTQLKTDDLTSLNSAIEDITKLISQKKEENKTKFSIGSSNTLSLMEKTLATLKERQLLIEKKHIIEQLKKKTELEMEKNRLEGDLENLNKEIDQLKTEQAALSKKINQYSDMLKESDENEEAINTSIKSNTTMLLIREAWLNIKKEQTESKESKIKEVTTQIKAIENEYKKIHSAPLSFPKSDISDLFQEYQKLTNEGLKKKITNSGDYPFINELKTLTNACINSRQLNLNHGDTELLILMNQIVAAIHLGELESIDEGLKRLQILQDYKQNLSISTQNPLAIDNLFIQIKTYFEEKKEILEFIEKSKKEPSESLDRQLQKINEQLATQLNPKTEPTPYEKNSQSLKIIITFFIILDAVKQLPLFLKKLISTSASNKEIESENNFIEQELNTQKDILEKAKTLKGLDEAITTLEEAITKLEEEINDLNSESESTLEKILALEPVLEANKEQYNQLKEKLSSEQNLIFDKEFKIKHLETEISSLQQRPNLTDQILGLQDKHRLNKVDETYNYPFVSKITGYSQKVQDIIAAIDPNKTQSISDNLAELQDALPESHEIVTYFNTRLETLNIFESYQSYGSDALQSKMEAIDTRLSQTRSASEIPTLSPEQKRSLISNIVQFLSTWISITFLTRNVKQEDPVVHLEDVYKRKEKIPDSDVIRPGSKR